MVFAFASAPMTDFVNSLYRDRSSARNKTLYILTCNLLSDQTLYRDTRIGHKACTWTAKSGAIPFLHRDPPAGGAKVPGPDSYRDCPDAASGNTTSPYCQAVIVNCSNTLP